MTNKRKDKRKRVKNSFSSRGTKKLKELKKNKMTEAQRKENEKDVLAGIDAQAARNIVIVNEEFAKLTAMPASQEAVTAVKDAILARFAKRDVPFRASVVAEFGEEEVPDEDLTGVLD